jgi:hypothetical protein
MLSFDKLDAHISLSIFFLSIAPPGGHSVYKPSYLLLDLLSQAAGESVNLDVDDATIAKQERFKGVKGFPDL